MTQSAVPLIEIVLPWAPRLPNRRRGRTWQARHYADQAEIKRAHDEIGWVLTVMRAMPAAPLSGVRVEIVRHSQIRPDRDNLYASCKFVLDGMVQLGLLKDDSDEHIDFDPRWQRRKTSGKGRKAFITIRITEVTK